MDLRKIGILLPQSKQNPTMTKEFMNGLRLSLPNSEYKLVIEGIGLGNNPEHIINASQKLINQEEVVLTTGILGHRGLNDITDFFEEMDEKLIFADFGATKPIDLSDKKNSFCNSLNLYEATYSLGKYLIEKGYNKIGTSSCFYESGYGFIEALQDSLYENDKGQFSGHFITPLHPRENESELMSQFVLETKPDALFASYNGVYAEEHASFLKQSKVNTKIPLYTLPFSIGNKVLTKFPEIFDGTKYISSWCIDLKTEENKKFIQQYQQKYNTQPSIFSVLGYENGLLIHSFLRNQNSFSSQKSLGPRGAIYIDNNTNRTHYKQYLWELEWKEQTYNQKRLEEINQVANKTNYITIENENGWQNAYLCV